MTTAAFALGLWLAAQGADLPTLILPPDVDAWVIRVVTSGGFTGRGTGSYTASSAGEFLCASVAACPGRLVPGAQQSLTRLIAALRFPVTVPAAPQGNSGVCNDCVTTTLTVRRRDVEGEQTGTFTWDPITASVVPEEIRRLAAAVIAAAASRPSQ